MKNMKEKMSQSQYNVEELVQVIQNALAEDQYLALDSEMLYNKIINRAYNSEKGAVPLQMYYQALEAVPEVGQIYDRITPLLEDQDKLMLRYLGYNI